MNRSSRLLRTGRHLRWISACPADQPSVPIRTPLVACYLALGALLFAFGTPPVVAQEQATAAAAPDTTVAAPREEPRWQARHEAINERARQGDVDLVFLGDSITQGWNDNEVWQKFYGHRRAANQGIGGDRTQHVLWRIDHGNLEGLSPKLVVLMIGTNNARANSPQEIAAGIRAIVERLREKLPETKVLLLAIFPRSEMPDELRATNTEASRLVADLDDGRMVHYLDIGPHFLSEDGTISKEIMPDFLHLSLAGYQIWAEAIEAHVARLLGE